MPIIKDLIEKSGMYPTNDPTVFGFDAEKTSYYCKGYMLDELVKLIILECVDNAFKNGIDVDKLKNHFGVR